MIGAEVAIRKSGPGALRGRSPGQMGAPPGAFRATLSLQVPRGAVSPRLSVGPGGALYLITKKYVTAHLVTSLATGERRIVRAAM